MLINNNKYYLTLSIIELVLKFLFFYTLGFSIDQKLNILNLPIFSERVLSSS